MIVVVCACRARYVVPDDLDGKRVKCPRCSRAILIEAPEPESDRDDAAYAVEVLDEDEGIIRDAVAADFSAPALAAEAGIPAGSASLAAFLRDCAESLMFFAETGNLLRFVVLAAIAMIWPVVALAPCVGFLATLIIMGWILSFLFNVMLNAANGERDLPELSLLEGPVETVVVPLFKFVAAAVLVYWPAGAYTLLIGEPAAAETPWFWALVCVGVFLWPMAMLMSGIGGVSTFARADLVGLTLMRTLVPYVLVCLMTAAAFWSSAAIIDAVQAGSGQASKHPIALFCALQLITLYAWVVVMRIIGLYYYHFKQRFAWSWA